MTFTEYQEKASETKIYPDNMLISYPCLGLSEEVGEALGKIKKVYRDKHGIFTLEDIEAIKKELGDVLWYLSSLAIDLGIDLDDIAQSNIDKILSRKRNNTIHGSGDNR